MTAGCDSKVESRETPCSSFLGKRQQEAAGSLFEVGTALNNRYSLLDANRAGRAANVTDDDPSEVRQRRDPFKTRTGPGSVPRNEVAESRRSRTMVIVGRERVGHCKQA